MAAKVFKTIEEQIQILISKGLTVEDYDKTSEICPGTDKMVKVFVEGSTFEELYSLFKFDRYFRNIIFKNVLIVENNYK